MPRAPVSNACLFAGADFPVLPFLAPRVFVESPIPTHIGRQHGGKSSRRACTKQKKIGEKLRDRRATQGERCPSTKPSSGGVSLSRYLDASTRLPSTPVQLSGCSGSSRPASAIGRRYLDISAFARQHLRPYSTSSTDNSTPSLQNNRGNNAPLFTSRDAQSQSTQHERALKDVSRQLAKYKQERPSLTSHVIFKHGMYRSLRRREINLREHSATQVDLTNLGEYKFRGEGLIEAFAALDRAAYYRQIQQDTAKVSIMHNDLYIRFSTIVFEGDAEHKPQQAWDNWMGFDVETRKSAFRPILIYLLDRKPGRAMNFLHIIANDPGLRSLRPELIADALDHLARIHINVRYSPEQDWNGDGAASKQKFVPDFVHIYLASLAKQRNICSQDLLLNLVNLAEIADLKKLVDCFFEHKTHMGFQTTLHYANAFAKAGEITYSLRCLQNMKKNHPKQFESTMVDQEQLRFTCALILRESMRVNKHYHETPKVVAEIVGLGVRLETRLYNVVMKNAMEAGDYTTAFKVYDNLEENKIAPRPETYWILLHGCTSHEYPAMFSQFAKRCADVAFESKDTWLAGQYIHYLYAQHHEDEDKGKVLNLLRTAYLRYFDPTILEAISGIRLRESRPQSDMDQGQPLNGTLRLEHTNFVLYVMLRAEVEAAIEISPRQVENLYHRFKMAVEQDNDEVLSGLAEDPIIWNAFLWAFCKRGQFASASQVIKDMAVKSQPDVNSWNILMDAFFRRGQVQAAERIRELMSSRGINPSQFTYSIMLKGYAKAQLAERVGEVMQHVDFGEKLQPDLLRALTRVVNRKQLMQNMERNQAWKDTLAQEEADAKAKDDERRWTPPLSPSDVKRHWRPTGARQAQSSPSQESEVDMLNYLRPEQDDTMSEVPAHEQDQQSIVGQVGQSGASYEQLGRFVGTSSPAAIGRRSTTTDSIGTHNKMVPTVSKTLPEFSVRRVWSASPGYNGEG